MENNDLIEKILEKINEIRLYKKISIEKISNDISKDKSVTSRILNGKYTLDLITFINICVSIKVSPVDLLECILYPNEKRISFNQKNFESFEEILEKFHDYKNFFNN